MRGRNITHTNNISTNLKTKCGVQPNQNVNNLHLLVQIKM